MTRKAVLCIRHGESTFNAAWRRESVDPLHFDAPLSEAGREQVRHGRAALAGYPVEVVLTSPLTRALQTALGLFGDHPGVPPVQVVALLRERVENSCDIGRSPGELAADFPSLDLAQLAPVWWHANDAPDDRGICVEPLPVLQSRVAEFRTQLFGRPESVVAVVGHGTFLFHLTGKILGNCEMIEL